MVSALRVPGRYPQVESWAASVPIADRDIRVVNADTGELLRELTLDTTKDYQPLGRKPGPQTKT